MSPQPIRRVRTTGQVRIKKPPARAGQNNPPASDPMDEAKAYLAKMRDLTHRKERADKFMP